MNAPSSPRFSCHEVPRGSYPRLMTRLCNVDLLPLDDFALHPFSPPAAQDLHEIVIASRERDSFCGQGLCLRVVACTVPVRGSPVPPLIALPIMPIPWSFRVTAVGNAAATLLDYTTVGIKQDAELNPTKGGMSRAAIDNQLTH